MTAATTIVRQPARFGDQIQPACRHAVGAVLVFLHLLEGDGTDLPGEIALTEAELYAAQFDASAYVDLEPCRKGFVIVLSFWHFRGSLDANKRKARHACGGRARLHIDVQFSIDRDRRPHPADMYDVPDYAGRKIEVAPLLRLIREQDAFRPCREPIAETCDLGDRDGDRSWFSDRVRVSLGHVHSTCSGSGLACAVRAGRRHRDATPKSSRGLGLLRPAPRSGAWPRPCRRRRRSVSASG